MMNSPKSVGHIAPWFLRIGVGLVLVGYGINHYRNLTDFQGLSSVFFPTVPVLASVASLLMYVVPGLMIVGGALFAVKQLCWLSKLCIYASLGGILGTCGLSAMFGTGELPGTLMQFIIGSGVLLLTYNMAKKASCCSSGWGCGSSSCKCGPNCRCGTGDDHAKKM